MVWSSAFFGRIGSALALAIRDARASKAGRGTAMVAGIEAVMCSAPAWGVPSGNGLGIFGENR